MGGGIEQLATEIAAFPGRIRSLTVGKPTIKDVFLHLVGSALSDGEG